MKKIFYTALLIFVLSLVFANLALAEERDITSGVPVTAKIGTNDTHIYQFTTQKNGETYITLDQTTGGFSMYLYDADGRTIGGSYEYYSGNTIVISEDIPVGTYFLEIEPNGWSGISSASYRVKATYPSAFTRDATTYEPNDTKETGMKIASGSHYTSTAETSLDRDVYQFTTSKDGEIYITLDQTKGGFYFYLYDQNGDTVDYGSGYGSGRDVVLNKNVQQGTYYLAVEPLGWEGITSATYRIKATYPSTFTRNLSTYEPNDTKETSMSITSGSFYKSSADTRNDKDVYQFTTNKDGSFYITLDQTTGGFHLRLYDANGDTVDSGYAYASGNSKVLEGNIQKGTYYLEVEPYDWNRITNAVYRINATYPSTFSRNASTLEPNDTNETAAPLISNQAYSSTSASSIDRDVYQFTTNKSGKATILLDKTTGGAWIGLYDRNGTVVASNYLYTGGDVIKIEETLAQGTYYIHIEPYGWSGLTSSNYRLKATFADKTPSVDSIYDTGTALAGTAVSNIKVYAVVGSTKIAETTAKDGKYSMKIPKQKAGTKIGVYSIDAAGNRSSTKTITVVSSAVKATSIGYNKLKVSWAQMPGTQGYEVYRSTSSTGTYSKVGTVTSGSTLSFTNSSLTTGKTYYYKVKPYKTVSSKKVYYAFSNIGSAKPTLAAPAKVTAAKASTTAIKTTWAKVGEASGYEVYHATAKTGTYTKVKTLTTVSSLTFTNTGLGKGKTYYYKVRAYRVVSGKKIYSPYTTIVSTKL
ncbi:Fibronectin type III domain-containing protein [Planococcus glaciei]|uniref:pre-peptidase C-terminal domain-containing protein n=1 Tax=Planococcus glaciei TaxID=459472 RepID=UPI00088D5901|nr:pre-peptidase C-terminal domain-containing protein [Planococcus glaciei]SDI64213.1 Fibronectin type III domain-containing protein [Planococcus glaciei]